MAGLRPRRPYTAPSDDPDLDDAAPADILAPSEQTSVVEELVERAKRAQREYALAGIALTAAVLLLISIFYLPGTVAPPFLARLVALSLVVSLSRQLYAVHSSTPMTSLDAIPALPSALLAVIVLYAPGDAHLRLLWGVAPLGVQLLAGLLHWEGRRAVKEAQGLRGLMYDAPEA